MLARAALGIGAASRPFTGFRDAQMKELLGIPSDVENRRR